MMADIQARREARRRKILENSENRLRKITNLEKQYVEGDQKSREETPSVVEHYETHTDRSFPIVSDNEVNVIYQNLELEDESLSNFEFEQKAVESSNLRICIIVMLALLVRFVLLISWYYSISAYSLNKIFLPLLMYEMIEFIFFAPVVESNGILSIFLFLSNRNDHFEKLIKIVFTFSRFITDLMIYFFTFVSFDMVIDSILQER